MKKIAIVYLSNYVDWPLGGMLNYVLNILPFIKQKTDWQVDIWGGKLSNDSDNADINVYTKIKTQKKIVPNFVRSFFGIIKNRRKFRDYDIIYSHTSATTIAMKFCFPNKFVVHHQHGLSYKYNHGIIRILNIGYFFAQKMADVSFFVASKEEVEEHNSLLCFKTKVFYSIGSPVDVSIYRRSNNQTGVTRFIYTGRIDSWKNIELLVKSFAIYNKYNNASALTIVGDGPDYNNILNLVSELQMNKTIRMTGRLNRNEIVIELENSDIFVFPSNGEGVSLSIIEALAAGLPIVGLNVIGVRDFIVPGVTGFFAENSTPDEFAEAMIRASNNYRNMSSACKESVKGYDSRIIAKEICNAIEYEYKKVCI